MNIKISHDWLLEYLDTKATPEEIQKYVSLCGPSIERIEQNESGDHIYDIEITSNRIDTASVVGIAREAAAILNRAGIPSVFKKPEVLLPEKAKTTLPLIISDNEKTCRRLLGIVMDNITVQSSDPIIKKRLENAGIRSINTVVDITNYVMLEFGHPSHVFDYDRIKTHTLMLRHARDGEEIITLDEKKYTLCSKDVVIDDGTGNIIDLPGIMGTQNSVVTPNTKRIIFFIESNDPVSIRGSSMRYAIRTMAAAINEKGPDPETAKLALLRGIQLFQKFTQARPAGDIADIYPVPWKEQKVKTTFGFINKLVGTTIPKQDVLEILNDLELKPTEVGDDIIISVPASRANDVSIPEDIVEEVARIYGYHNLPNNLSPARFIKQPKESEDLFRFQQIIKQYLKHLGLNEVLNYSMISLDMILGLDLLPTDHLCLANVLSEEIKYMRRSLMPSLIKNIKLNEGRKELLQLFELAKVYLPVQNQLPEEQYKLGIVVNNSWSNLKGIIEGLLDELHIDNYSFENANHKNLASPQAILYIHSQEVGFLGNLAPQYRDNNKIKSDCFVAELDFNVLIKNAKKLSPYKRLHPYAVIKLDTTIELNSEKTYAFVKEKAYKTAPHLIQMTVKDRFKNNITLGLLFSAGSHNLTENEAKEELKSILAQIS